MDEYLGNVNTYSTNAANGFLSPGSISITGGGQPHENRQPSWHWVISFVISAFILHVPDITF